MEECNYCRQTFKSSSLIVRHKRRAHSDKLDNICPTCGELFDTVKGMRYHHTVSHGESIAYTTVNCEVCDEEKEISKIRKEKHARFYCGKECESDWKEENQIGYWKGVTGKDFPLTGISKITKEGRKRLSESKMGEKNPQWVDGDVSSERGRNWERQRKKARERDDFECQQCGMSENKNQVTLDVHHIIRFHDFDDWKKANRLENLICLCRSCHRSIENNRSVEWQQKNLR